jgi:hypothetical protein
MAAAAVVPIPASLGARDGEMSSPAGQQRLGMEDAFRRRNKTAGSSRRDG